jgi:hypothetical protein
LNYTLIDVSLGKPNLNQRLEGDLIQHPCVFAQRQNGVDFVAFSACCHHD